MNDMIRAIIVDDEQHCIDLLQSLLQRHFLHQISIEASCKTVTEAMLAIKQLQPQLVFLDVQIQHETAFELLQQFAAINFEVIFTTAYEKYAVQAFKFSALDYLLKPVLEEDLRIAVGKVKAALNQKQTSARLEVLFGNMRLLESQQRRICIPVSTGLIFLQVSDIIRCESNINYTTLYTADKRKIVAAKTLKDFEEMLVESNFYRVHNSHLINLHYIRSYSKNGAGGTVVLSDGTEVAVATRRKDEFLKKIQN